jgi:hypothetical protein
MDKQKITAAGKQKAESIEFALELREKAKELSEFEADAIEILRRAEIALALSEMKKGEGKPGELGKFIDENLEEIDRIDQRAKQICIAFDAGEGSQQS